MKNCNWGQGSRTGGLLPPSLYVKRGPAECLGSAKIQIVSLLQK